MPNRIRPLRPNHRVSVYCEPGCMEPSKELEKIAKKAIRAVIYELGGDIFLSVELVFAGTEQIRQVNNTFRGIDAETDVLSFPALEIKKGRRPEEVAGPGDFDAWGIFIGSIMICPEVAEKKARENGLSLQEEYAFLAAHGTLHLLGYDHESGPKDEEEMFALQERIMKRVCVKA